MRKEIRRFGMSLKKPVRMTRGLKIVNCAKHYVGQQLKRNPPTLDIDCSLFTQMIFAKYGIRLLNGRGNSMFKAERADATRAEAVVVILKLAQLRASEYKVPVFS